jgi:tetratricopeptide (TPR) repeat protein
MTLVNSAYIYQKRGQYDLAQETLRLGMQKAQESGYLRTQSLAVNATAEILRDIEKYREALAANQKGLELAREVMEAYYVAWAKAGLGETHRLLGNRDRAEMLIREAVAEAKQHGLAYETQHFMVQMGIMDYETGSYDSAIQTLGKAASSLVRMHDKDALAKAYFHLAQAHFLSKRFEEALEWLKKSCKLADSMGYDEFMVVEGRKATMMMEYAISKGVETERFNRIIDRLRQRRKSTTDIEIDEFAEHGIGQHDMKPTPSARPAC